MVYVLNKNGQPIMPTERHAHIRRLLKKGCAKIVTKSPFTIQLLYDTEDATQEITLGVDSGSKKVGLSATTKQKELYVCEVELRSDIVELLSTRRENRRTRRNRKTRYRKARFDNRKCIEGWLAPSVEQKIQSHIKVIKDVHKILPISKIIIEVASFDIQKIKNPDISGKEYQAGEQLNSWNVREYVLFRDGHECQCCHGKSKDKVLSAHHIESRKTGGDSPGNMVTLCRTCHKKYHGKIMELPKSIKRTASFRDAAFMGIMRWELYFRLKILYSDVKSTYGYITKNTRIKNKLEKTHCVDAKCISGNPLDSYYYKKKLRRHNRQTHKCNPKNGVRKANQASYKIKGSCLYDKVLYNNQICFITGRRATGYFVLKTLDGKTISNSAKCTNLKLIERSAGYATELRANAVS